MRHLLYLIPCLALACGGETADDPSPDAAPNTPDACDCPDGAVDAQPGPDPDAALPDPDAQADPDAGPDPDARDPDPDAGPQPDQGLIEPMDLVIDGGDVSGVWCGSITLQGTVTVPEGETLTVCEGTQVRLAGDRATNITVVGTLSIQGTADAPVEISGDPWRGLRVGGVLDATHLRLADAINGIDGAPGGEITVRESRIERCETSLILANGGTFERTTIIGGTSIRQTGGMWTMTDSVIDFQHPPQAPDCTAINGGGLAWDHVRVTGCHCPIHINGAPDGVTVTNSVFDGSSYPVMIAGTQAVFTDSHFAGVSDHFLDVGGDFRAELSGNWYEGGAPRLRSGDMSQFVGADDWVADEIEGVGPRGELP